MLNTSGFVHFLKSPRSLPRNPWIYFPLFLLADSFLSYGNASLSTNLWIFFIGLVVPLTLALTSKPRPSPTPIHQVEVLDSIPHWAWWTILGVSLLARIGQLTLWAPWL